MNERWLQEEMADIDRFIDECYNNDIVWEEEVGPMITFDSLVGKFTFFWEGKVKYFDSHETAEDWIKLNNARRIQERKKEINQ